MDALLDRIAELQDTVYICSQEAIVYSRRSRLCKAEASVAAKELARLVDDAYLYSVWEERIQ